MKKRLVTAYILAGALFLSGALGTFLLLKPKKMNVVQVLRDVKILFNVYIIEEDDRFLSI